MEPYPLLFEPILKPKVWGGRSLEALGKTLPRGSAIGESWELADLPATIEGGRSVIRNGALTGRTLREAIDAHATIIMGDVTRTSDGGFPLLVKYLDARENLSVQVHPSPAYAAAHPDAHLKSEAWVVIDHEPGAVIYRGLRPGATRDRFARHIATGAIVD
ncbi:MAG: hypothetical protein KDA25_11875, partial [Phycisphaerales bacterium]|nr:hypothetical protein [Phycisphaerales bacterium]